VDGNLTVALEIMIITPAIRNLIRENKIYQIQNIINTNAKLGMISMDQSLLNLYQNGIISKECLLDRCVDYEYIIKLVGDLI
jgi:twitching motility protein PilT